MSGVHGIDEGRRQAYLAALGIPLWTARQALPGALPADGLDFVPYAAEVEMAAAEEDTRIENPRVETAAPESAWPEGESGRITAPPQPDHVSSMVEAGLRGTGPVPDMSRDQRPPVVATAGTGGHPRFACRIQLLAPGWMGVIGLEDVPDLSAREYRLLGNLVQALGGDGAAEYPREHFRWPLSPNPAIPRDAAAAREALAAFLNRQRHEGRWLVLGETLAVYVRAALPPQTVVAAPLLRELLESPLAKRSLWQALHG